jgi:hypothetical protein
VPQLAAPTDVTAPDAPIVRHRTARSRTWRRVAFVGLAGLFAGETVYVAPYFDGAMSDLYRADEGWLALAVVSQLASIAVFARLQRRMLAAGGARVDMRHMVALTYIANAVSVCLPGGAALSAGYVFRRLRSWGATVPAAGFTVFASGLLSTLSFALLAVACAVIAGSGGLSSLTVIGLALASIAALAVVRRRRPDVLALLATRALVRGNRVFHRPPEAGLAGLRRVVADLSAVRPRKRDWLAGFGFAELNWIADLACLLACCEAVDPPRFSILVVAVAYLAGKAAASLSLVPGGLGVVDAAMVFTLTRGGVTTVSAATEVLLYRLISFVLVVTLGWMIWAVTRIVERQRPARRPLRRSAQRRADETSAGENLRTVSRTGSPQVTVVKLHRSPWE